MANGESVGPFSSGPAPPKLPKEVEYWAAAGASKRKEGAVEVLEVLYIHPKPT